MASALLITSCPHFFTIIGNKGAFLGDKYCLRGIYYEQDKHLQEIKVAILIFNITSLYSVKGT